jgi:hypothetical protein
MDDLIPRGARRGCAIFAHPDDESLWCGGLIGSSGLDWTVVCCSIPEKDPIRAYKFFEACEALGAKGRLLPFGEKSGLLRIEEVNLTGFDLVLTHGPAGEYGHPQHIELHDRLFRFCPVPLRTIGYRKGGLGRFAYPLDNVAKHTKLEALKKYDHVSPSDKKPKWKALLDYYGQKFDLWTETYD